MRGLRSTIYPTEAEILAMWRAGKNTLDIATAFFVQEAWVAEQIPGILLRERRIREWEAYAPKAAVAS